MERLAHGMGCLLPGWILFSYIACMRRIIEYILCFLPAFVWTTFVYDLRTRPIHLSQYIYIYMFIYIVIYSVYIGMCSIRRHITGIRKTFFGWSQWSLQNVLGSFWPFYQRVSVVAFIDIFCVISLAEGGFQQKIDQTLHVVIIIILERRSLFFFENGEGLFSF